jgi:hypothetical protein
MAGGELYACLLLAVLGRGACGGEPSMPTLTWYVNADNGGQALLAKKCTDAAAGLDEHLDGKPSQLSGGQRQRVAMGRAIVREADAFLGDRGAAPQPGARARQRLAPDAARRVD